MQCPDGTNILIQRQKSGLVNAMSAIGGLFTFGFAAAAINQIAGCNAVGFEFWKDHALREEQGLKTTSGFGYDKGYIKTYALGMVNVRGGLEELRTPVRQDVLDKKAAMTPDETAVQACDKLKDTAGWTSMKAMWALEGVWGGPDRQQKNAAECLAHSKLCGPTMLMAEADLQVTRFNPFTHEGMCAPSIEQMSEDKRVAEFLKDKAFTDDTKKDLLQQDQNLQLLVIDKFAPIYDGMVGVDVASIEQKFKTLLDQLKDWQNDKTTFLGEFTNIDEENKKLFDAMPLEIQVIVMKNFKPSPSGDADPNILFKEFMEATMKKYVFMGVD